MGSYLGSNFFLLETVTSLYWSKYIPSKPLYEVKTEDVYECLTLVIIWLISHICKNKSKEYKDVLLNKKCVRHLTNIIEFNYN